MSLIIRLNQITINQNFINSLEVRISIIINLNMNSFIIIFKTNYNFDFIKNYYFSLENYTIMVHCNFDKAIIKDIISHYNFNMI